MPFFPSFVGVITPNMKIMFAACKINLSAPLKEDGETIRFVGGLQLNKILKIRCNATGAFWLDNRHACCKYLMQAINITVL